MAFMHSKFLRVSFFSENTACVKSLSKDQELGTAENFPTRKTRWFALVVAIMAVAVCAYRLLVIGHLEQTALMFIGLPTFLAIMLAFLPAAGTVVGKIVKGITLFLLLLGILAIEGFICILMAAPFFYFIGITVGIVLDSIRARKQWQKDLRIMVVPVLLFMSIEGINDLLSFGRNETVTITHTTALNTEEAIALLALGPSFDLNELPIFLKLGFPEPQHIKGDGLNLGDNWSIHFAGGEGAPGTLLAKVTNEKGKHFVVSKIEDTSHIAHWLNWQSAEWHLTPVEEGTLITLKINYERLLDPAWYFKPLQRHGVKLAGKYFLKSTYKD